MSLIKGVEHAENGEMRLISQNIAEKLGINMSVLMGANIANEVAKGEFCESTLGYSISENASLLKNIFHCDSFRISTIRDIPAVELCGALKNIVAVAAGFADGLGMGDNSKAAIIRIGLVEIVKFCKLLYPSTNSETFFESCGVADLITSCYGGRNRKVGEAFSKCNGSKSISQLEKEMLNGQKLQGPDTAHHVFHKLQSLSLACEFPLFSAVHKICNGEENICDFVKFL